MYLSVEMPIKIYDSNKKRYSTMNKEKKERGS